MATLMKHPPARCLPAVTRIVAGSYPAPAGTSPGRRRRARRIGAVLGFVIPAALAVAGWGVTSLTAPGGASADADTANGLVMVLAWLAALAAVVGGAQGWRSGPWVASLDPGLGPGAVARFALRAVLLGAAAVAVVVGVAATAQTRPPEPIGGLADTVEALGYAIAVAAGFGAMALLYGMALFGVPAWIGAMLIVALWARLVRRVVGVEPAPDAGSMPVDASGDDLPTGPPPGRADGTRPVGHPRPADLGWIGGALTLAAALGLTSIRASADGASGLGLTLLAIVATLVAFAGPGLVAMVGAARDRPAVLAAAGIACFPLAVLAFSGVTLVMLAPACLLLYAGMRPLAGSPDRPVPGGLVVAIAGLLIVGGVAPFLAPDTVCWDRYAEPGMGVIVRLSPDEPNGPSDVPVLGSGCDGGQTSLIGGSVAIVAVAVAVALAIHAGSRDDDRPDA